MEDRIYRDMALFQERHWWFRARRDILCTIIGNLELPEKTSILEIGCGTGGNIGMLKQFGYVSAMDTDELAVAWAKKISHLKIDKGGLPDNFPFYPHKFDLICLFDVLEHIERDLDALKETIKWLKDEGWIIITVPAHMFLFGIHDINMHHFRRYSKEKLKQMLMGLNLEIVKLTYFNTILFPAMILARCLDYFIKGENSTGYNIPYLFLNQLLYRLFTMEKQIINIMDMPVGSSLIAVCKKSRN